MYTGMGPRLVITLQRSETKYMLKFSFEKMIRVIGLLVLKRKWNYKASEGLKSKDKKSSQDWPKGLDRLFLTCCSFIRQMNRFHIFKKTLTLAANFFKTLISKQEMKGKEIKMPNNISNFLKAWRNCKPLKKSSLKNDFPDQFSLSRRMGHLSSIF